MSRTRRPKVSAADKRQAQRRADAELRRLEIAAELQSSTDRLNAAAAFTRKYDGITVERSESQSFWNDLLGVFGIDRREVGAEFERVTTRTDTGGTGRIDVLWPGVLLAEHKSTGRDFASALTQADAYELSEDEKPRLTVVCDFARFLIRDNHTGNQTEFDLSAFPEHLGWFGPLVHNELEDLGTARPVDVKAAERMADLHDEMRAAGYTGHPLRILMTRLLFCFFADDARIWEHGKLDKYLKTVPAAYAGSALESLFDVLNTEPGGRSANLSDELASFPYVNGGLFAERLPLSYFTPTLLNAMVVTSEEVDWSAVSPAVFGAMFQGVMDSVERHELGAHYTSEENILRVIEPLFLDQLYQDIENAGTVAALERVWTRIAGWKFLDPAAGCGNFLVVSYRELRRAERHLMEKLRDLAKGDTRLSAKYPWVRGQRFLDSGAASRLGVGQFYGIEIDEWPAQIAQVAMWLTDHLENMALEEQFGGQQTRLPLIDTAHITVGNSLRLDWSTVVSPHDASFVLGNPPFLGTAMQSVDQKHDTRTTWGTVRGAGNLDYVTCWFKKAADFIDRTDIRVGLVSTNSVSQGEQPAILWGYLHGKDCHIDFAHRSFSWTNEAKGKAAVHVVITGFSQGVKPGRKPLWDYPSVKLPGNRTDVASINGYLVSGPELLVHSRREPLYPGVKKIQKGSQATDGGNLFFTADEAARLESEDAAAFQHLRKVVGSSELIQGKDRWCLWLVDVDPQTLRSSKVIQQRTSAVRAMRQASTKAQTRALSSTPSLFTENRQPGSVYLAVPRVTSERREYVPTKFLPSDTIATDALLTVENADLFTFGVLSSRVFNVWNATVSGRLKSDYRISAEITYNNFPFPTLTTDETKAVEGAAQAVLDARASFPTSTLADLYDPLSMPPALVKAHRNLDRVVLKAFGLKPAATDAAILTELFTRYQTLVAKESEPEPQDAIAAGDH